jgi:hypothetical protein
MTSVTVNIKVNCAFCKHLIKRNHRAIQCDICDGWLHIKCANLSNSDNVRLGISNENWYCNNCLGKIFPFMDATPINFHDVVPTNL